MTHMTYTPGYQGYLRNFQRDWLSGKDAPSSKYRDFELESHGLMADSRWASQYASRFAPHTFLYHQEAQPQGTTRMHPIHKDERQAARRVAEKEAREKEDKQAEQENQQKNAGKAGWGASAAPAPSSLSPLSSSSSSSSSPYVSSPASQVPLAGRGRNLGRAVYGTTYGDSIGTGLRSPPAPRVPRFPYPSSDFSLRNAAAGVEMLPALDGTINKSLAQALASIPAAENILSSTVDAHGSYARDYGHRGHHPLQRSSGYRGGAALIHPTLITAGAGDPTYPQRAVTHEHLFPSSTLIGPSGAKAGPHPIECLNDYPHTSYANSKQAGSNGGNNNNNADRTLCDIGTTKELFAGSIKSNIIRPPGYSGFIPASENNLLSLTGVQPQPSTKDQILHIYKHDLPGYTGHQPNCVVNVRGPRTPRGKKRLNEGLVASLILDSMKI